MKLYRGMWLERWESGTGLIRKGTQTVDQLYAGDTRASAGDTLITVGGPSEGNALSMHSLDSGFYRGAFLSFTASFDVAAFYALKDRWETQEIGIVVETTSKHLATLGIRAEQNAERYPWEQEFSVVMDKHEAFPFEGIAVVHHINVQQFRQSAAALNEKWPDVKFPDFLREAGH